MRLLRIGRPISRPGIAAHAAAYEEPGKSAQGPPGSVDGAQGSQQGREGARTGPFEGGSGHSQPGAAPPFRARSCGFPQPQQRVSNLPGTPRGASHRLAVAFRPRRPSPRRRFDATAAPSAAGVGRRRPLASPRCAGCLAAPLSGRARPLSGDDCVHGFPPICGPTEISWALRRHGTPHGRRLCAFSAAVVTLTGSVATAVASLRCRCTPERRGVPTPRVRGRER